MFRELGISIHPSSSSYVLWADQGSYKARFAFTQFAIFLQSSEVHAPPHGALSNKRVSDRGSDRLAGQMYPAFGYLSVRLSAVTVAMQTGVLGQLEFSSTVRLRLLTPVFVCVFSPLALMDKVICGDFLHCSGGKTVFPVP
jgi:hypothetical protein